MLPISNSSRPLIASILATGMVVQMAAFVPRVYAAERKVPPAGITIEEPVRAELTEGAAALRREINALSVELTARPELRALLPDVEIFHKAVDWALRYDEIFDPKEIEAAREQLATGRTRLGELREGRASWTAADGLVVRAYQSRVDDSIQPYGLVIPKDWMKSPSTPRPLWLWFHGRAEKLSELAFLRDRMRNPGDLVPENAIVLHLYGRFCNANKFAGETDLFEALADVQRRYAIDPERIAVTGFSMGGAAAWHVAAHHAGRWAAAGPGAGFAETAEFAKIFAEGKEPPPWWEQMLWRWYDATAYAANLSNLPVIAYSGELDKQRQAAEIMSKAMAAEGLPLEHLIGPQTEHKYHPETKAELIRKLSAHTAEGRAPMPPRVRFTTWTLRYGSMEWLKIDGLERHWTRADIDAQLVDEGTFRIQTKNVSAFTIALPTAPAPLDKTHPPRVVIDEEELVGPPVTDYWTAHFQKVGGKWSVVRTAQEVGLRKRLGMTGPIDDAFLDRFVFVRPTGTPGNAQVGAWAAAEMQRAIAQWRTVFRGDVRVIDDRALTKEVIADSHLVLWGDTASNSVLSRVAADLPIRWDSEEVRVGGKSYPATHHAPVFIHPNPLNPARYVVVNSSFTFRAGSAQSNAVQTPKLPDWAVIDLRTPPDLAAPGAVVDAGFFDEQWQAAK
ncbi:MAG TPA: prolyl oligopeptidase family serine peptidase [Chthoniobacteraceae bacterium]|jgi:dienelactone hydrolase